MSEVFDLACSILLPLRKPMASMNDAPCRVSADLRAKMHQDDHYMPSPFDPMVDWHVGAVVPAELVKPVTELLLTLEQIEKTEGSFGLDKAKAYEHLIKPLQMLRDGCIDRWKDL